MSAGIEWRGEKTLHVVRIEDGFHREADPFLVRARALHIVHVGFSCAGLLEVVDRDRVRERELCGELLRPWRGGGDFSLDIDFYHFVEIDVADLIANPVELGIGFFLGVVI